MGEEKPIIIQLYATLTSNPLLHKCCFCWVLKSHFIGNIDLWNYLKLCRFILTFCWIQKTNSLHIGLHTSWDLHWEKQVLDQYFHKTLISSYILLTLTYTLSFVFIGRNKFLIKAVTRPWSVHIFSLYGTVLSVQRMRRKWELSFEIEWFKLTFSTPVFDIWPLMVQTAILCVTNMAYWVG